MTRRRKQSDKSRPLNNEVRTRRTRASNSRGSTASKADSTIAYTTRSSTRSSNQNKRNNSNVRDISSRKRRKQNAPEKARKRHDIFNPILAINNLKEQNCACCLDPIVSMSKGKRVSNKKVTNDIAQTDTCGHTFHFQCINTWAQHETTCPLCKAIFKQVGVYDSQKGTLTNVRNFMVTFQKNSEPWNIDEDEASVLSSEELYTSDSDTESLDSEFYTEETDSSDDSDYTEETKSEHSIDEATNYLLSTTPGQCINHIFKRFSNWMTPAVEEQSNSTTLESTASTNIERFPRTRSQYHQLEESLNETQSNSIDSNRSNRNNRNRNNTSRRPRRNVVRVQVPPLRPKRSENNAIGNQFVLNPVLENDFLLARHENSE